MDALIVLIVLGALIAQIADTVMNARIAQTVNTVMNALIAHTAPDVKVFLMLPLSLTLLQYIKRNQS